jgi:hypothetical protein
MTTNDIRELLDQEGVAAEEMTDVETPMVRNRASAKDPSQVYSLRLPVDRIEEVRRLAVSQSLAPTALLRRWILERLDVELERRQLIEDEPIYASTREDLGDLVKELLQQFMAMQRGKHVREP